MRAQRRQAERGRRGSLFLFLLLSIRLWLGTTWDVITLEECRDICGFCFLAAQVFIGFGTISRPQLKGFSGTEDHNSVFRFWVRIHRFRYRCGIMGSYPSLWIPMWNRSLDTWGLLERGFRIDRIAKTNFRVSHACGDFGVDLDQL